MLSIVNKLKKIQASLDDDVIKGELLSTIEENSELAADITREQLNLGIDTSGAELPDYKSIKYLAKKNEPKTAKNGKYNLKLSGDFHRSIYVRITNKEVEVDATDEKYQKGYMYAITGRNDSDNRLLSWSDEVKVSENFIKLIRLYKQKLNERIKAQ